MANIQAILREPGVEGALWTLGASDDPQNPKSPNPIQHNSHDQEAVILKDERAVVDRVHYSPGGTYCCMYLFPSNAICLMLTLIPYA